MVSFWDVWYLETCVASFFIHLRSRSISQCNSLLLRLAILEKSHFKKIWSHWLSVHHFTILALSLVLFHQFIYSVYFFFHKFHLPLECARELLTLCFSWSRKECQFISSLPIATYSSLDLRFIGYISLSIFTLEWKKIFQLQNIFSKLKNELSLVIITSYN